MSIRSFALPLVVGLVAGYAVAGTSTTAQTDSLPFAIGDTVTLKYETTVSESYVECGVADIRGEYVRCESRGARFGSEPTENWYSLRSVAQIRKRVK